LKKTGDSSTSAALASGANRDAELLHFVDHAAKVIGHARLHRGQ